MADGAGRSSANATDATPTDAAVVRSCDGLGGAFVQRMSEFMLGDEVRIVRVPLAGVPFSPEARLASKPRSHETPSFRDALDRLRPAMGHGEVCAVIWNGGSREGEPTDARSRELELRSAISNLRHDLGLAETVPFVTWTPPRAAGEQRLGLAGETRPDDRAAQCVMERVAAAVPYVGLVSARGIPDCGDERRLDAASQRELGERLFRMWRSMSAVSPEKRAAQAAKYRDAPRIRTRVLLDPGVFLVTSPFGRRRHPVTGEAGAMHNGVDGALWNGQLLLETGICAWRKGVVSEAADGTGPAGTFAVIDHGGGWTSRYFHLEAGSLRVRAGDRIAAGALLGWMGKTGRATGEHLHFQLERDGVPTDPTPLLGR